MGGLITEVADYQNTPSSIGYTFHYYVTRMNDNMLKMRKQIKLLAINGVAPTEENIRNGTYPYIVDAYMVTRENPTPETQKFVDWFISQQGQQLVEDVGYVPLYEASPNHQDNNDEYNQTLYLSVISRLCYCAVVGVADGGCAGCLYYHAEFSGEMLFSIPLMIRRISLLQLQLWLSAEYALFFCVMCCVGWQFTRRTQSELKSRLHCWLVFAPVYLWLILWNIIFTSRQRKLRCWKVSAISFCLLSGYP